MKKGQYSIRVSQKKLIAIALACFFLFFGVGCSTEKQQEMSSNLSLNFSGADDVAESRVIGAEIDVTGGLIRGLD